MPIRLVALDLDGTLLNSRSDLSLANQQALLAATARGAHVAVATGRRSHSAHKYVARIPCPVTLISSNGAMITTPAGEVLHRDFLPRAVARQVLEITRAFRPYMAAIFDQPGRGQVTMQEGAIPEGPLGWYLAQSADFLELVPDLEAILSNDPIQVLFGGPPASIEPIERLLADSAIAPRVHLSWTKYLTRNVSLLDVMNRGCTKGAALAFLADHLGIEPAEVMAIGDNFNDLEMLQFAGLPVVMENSTPGLPRDDWRVTLSNDQDGVAAAIHSYVLK
jgi:Cof subfamily protein (haloacid dehalogenase superfamily)